MEKINIASQFSSTPGARFRSDGDFSGEEFREKFLEKYFTDKNNEEKIEIYLDGTLGYPTSFLEECFGGLARKFGVERVQKKLVFISTINPLLIEEINSYIQDAAK